MRNIEHMEELNDDELVRLMVAHRPDKYAGSLAKLDKLRRLTLPEKRKLYDIGVDFTELPPGQHRAMEALIDGAVARTYPEAARLAEMALGTFLTHVNRVREKHPQLYEQVRLVRLAQLKVRHEAAMESARAHSWAYFRRRARWLQQLVG